ncbi:amidase [Amylostereum chailletii]|nr:amidase [Amylostereum chailletii]
MSQDTPSVAIFSPWQVVAKAKQGAVYSKIPSQWRIDDIPDANEMRDASKYPRTLMSPRAHEITETIDAYTLLSKIATGEYSAVEVTEAFCHRAAIAHQVVNALSEIMFEEALSRARELDEYYATYKKTAGPLHGLPVSLKDSFRVRGTNAAIGLVGLVDELDTPDTESFVVKELRELGAIIYVKTTVPMGVHHIDTSNNVTGITYSPRNRLMSAGGSSGGEGALISMHGSIVGIGTDIGASSRLPAAFNGIYGLKPSQGRFPYMGTRDMVIGNDAAPFVVGPMGTTVANLKLMAESLLHRRPWLHDPKVIELPWRSSEYDDTFARGERGGLVLGMLMFDGVIMPHPPVLRAIKELKEKLEAAGHEVCSCSNCDCVVIDWTPLPHAEATEIMMTFLQADGRNTIHSILARAGEPPVKATVDVIGTKPGNPVSVLDLWNANTKRYTYQTKYAHFWNNTNKVTKSGQVVDAVIFPTYPGASFRPGNGLYFGYTMPTNLLDYSSVVIPVSQVDKLKDHRAINHTPVNDLDKLIQSHYDPEEFDGSPIGLQIMGRRLQEEKVLALAAVIDRLASNPLISPAKNSNL